MHQKVWGWHPHAFTSCAGVRDSMFLVGLAIYDWQVLESIEKAAVNKAMQGDLVTHL